MIKARHILSFPQTSQLNIAIDNPDLEAIDFSGIGVCPPKFIDFHADPFSPLPKADYVFVVWTSSEFAALNHVFFSYSYTVEYRKAHDDAFNNTKWCLYQSEYQDFIDAVELKGALLPSRRLEAWGRYAMFELSNGKTILLWKSDMHPSRDGLIVNINDKSKAKKLSIEINQIPTTVFIEKIIREASPELIITSGTAGGTVNEDVIGTVNVTNQASCNLSKSWDEVVYKGIKSNGSKYVSKFTPKITSHSPSFFTKVPINDNQLYQSFTKHEVANHHDISQVKLSDLLNNATDPQSLLCPKLNNLCNIKPILSTNTFEVADTSGNYGQYAAMEMDDAFVAMVADYMKIPFSVVRNISDPISNHTISNLSGKALSDVQKTWSGLVYEKYGLYSSINSAITILLITSNL